MFKRFVAFISAVAFIGLVAIGTWLSVGVSMWFFYQMLDAWEDRYYE